MKQKGYKVYTTRETKLGRISIGDVIVVKTKKGQTGLGWIESLTPGDIFRKEINVIEYTPRENISLGETGFCHENVDSFENRIIKLKVVGRLPTREEWNRFVETCKHIIMLNCIKKADFEFSKKS